MSTKKSVDQFDLEGNFIQTWPSISLAVQGLGLVGPNVLRSLDCSTRSEGGYRWKTAVEQRATGELRYEPKNDYTDEQRKDFNDRIPRYMPVLYNLIKQYDFINEFNVDDYIQEALVIAWMQFYAYEPSPGDGQRFGAWFKVTCRWGIFRYFNYLKNWKVREYEDWLNEKPDEVDDSDARAIALYHCIELLTDTDREILKCYMEAKESREAMEVLNMTSNVYYKHIMRIKNILRENINYYLNGVKSIKTNMFTAARKNIAVEQFDLQGKFVGWFESIESTKEKGFNPTSVSAILNFRAKVHKGFMFKESKFENMKDAQRAYIQQNN